MFRPYPLLKITHLLMPAIVACLSGLAAVFPAMAMAPVAPLSFAELEVAGARIGEIVIVNRDIFDLDDPAENNALFRLANRLHVQTRKNVIKRNLLFASGDSLKVRVMEETERLLRSNRYFHDVHLRPVRYEDGVVDIEVMTRDTWTLNIGASIGRAGGSSSGSIGLIDYNLFGTGATVGYSRSSNSDRSSNELTLKHSTAFDGWTSLALTHADNSDGKRTAVSVLRPFYSLNTRWAGGVSAGDDERVESLSEFKYRHFLRTAEVFGGWSPGLIDGWTRRYSLGLLSQDDRFRVEPGEIAPASLSADQKVVAPFVRYELIEEDYERRSNRNQMGRPEFFALGFAATAQLGRARTDWGATDDLWLYSASVSRGYPLPPAHELLLSAGMSGRYGAGQVQRQLMTANARYYWQINPSFLLYAGATMDAVQRPALSDLLNLGGDNGLRGYPLRYQTGERRAVFTVEARAYSDLYLFNLFRIGGAAFLDVGSAWGGPFSDSDQPAWRRNAGIGLRIFSVRSAFGNVVHIDLAKPLDHADGIKTLQFLIKTKTSF